MYTLTLMAQSMLFKLRLILQHVLLVIMALTAMMYVQCRILVLGVPKNVPAFHVTIFTAVSIPVVQQVVNVVVRYKVKKMQIIFLTIKYFILQRWTYEWRSDRLQLIILVFWGFITLIISISYTKTVKTCLKHFITYQYINKLDIEIPAFIIALAVCLCNNICIKLRFYTILNMLWH